VKVVIHRGAAQIGGSCVEVESQGASLLLDLGAPLDSSEDRKCGQGDLPPSLQERFQSGVLDLKGVLVSHAHQDHYGLVGRLPLDVPALCGPIAARVMELAGALWGGGESPRDWSTFVPYEPFDLPPFKVTPYLVDHSVIDAYAFLVEADGRAALYSGDFRAHGRKEGLFRRLESISHPDVLLLEGTLVGPRSKDRHPSERELESALAECLGETPGLVLVSTGSTNLDRIVSLYKAARGCGRTFVLDLYTALLLDRIEGHPRLPKTFWAGIRVAFSKPLMDCFRKAGLAAALEKFRPRGIKWPQIAAWPEQHVLLIKPSMLATAKKYLQAALPQATWVYSLWPGYLDRAGGIQRMKTYLGAQGCRIVQMHTSGHVRLADMKHLLERVQPKVLIPIHTAHPAQFAAHFSRVLSLADGQPYVVP